jgi:riboflavin kinase/FMN adenylyltransferase
VTIWREVSGAVVASRTDPAAVTVGAFDGVHRGHQALLARTQRAGLPVVAVTFDPHPTAIFAPDHVPARLTTLERRVELLLRHGADEVRVLDFGREMAGWSPEEFVDRVLVEQLHAAEVVVGENFRFGARAAGDVAVLEQLGSSRGFVATGLGLEGDAEPWSSTRVRALVAQGRMSEVAELLGRPHEVVGEVVRGEQRGRELGYPTANTPVDDSYAVPPDGVYAGRVVRADGEALMAAVSIGTNPTFGEHSRRVESYVLDRDDLDLYGETIRVELVEHLRPMIAFDGVDALLAQMADDVTATRHLIPRILLPNEHS